MTKEKFLTRRWNNWLTLGLGFPTLIYVVVVLSTSILTDFVAYNVIYWLPILLAFTKIISYRTGFIALFVIVIFRAIANLIRNNCLTLEQAEIYPFRIP